MNEKEIKVFIAQKVQEGLSLSEIQDKLTAQGAKMTFMEVRLLASEIETEIFKAQEKKTEKEPEQPAVSADSQKAENTSTEDDLSEKDPMAQAEPEDAAKQSKPRGTTTVSISPIQRPGFLVSGSVNFGSGASADWFLDQTGRLAFDNVAGGKPDQQDLIDFQNELKKQLGA